MKILVIDDHPLIVDALAQLLPQLDPGLTMLAAGDPPRHGRARQRARHRAGAARSRAARRARARLPRRPRSSTIPACRSSCSRRRTIRRRCWRRSAPGAQGFIPKSANAEALLDAVRHVLDGGVYLPSDASRHADGRRRAPRARRAGPHRAADRRAEAPGPGQAQQADLSRPHAVGGNRQGPRQRDPQGVARAFAHRGDRRARAARHQRRHAGRAARAIGPDAR